MNGVLSLQEDVFELKALDIGKVVSITIGHCNVGRGRGWYCASLRLRVGDKNNQLLFSCDRLDSNSHIFQYLMLS